jgi:hypothetical protein
LSKRFKGRASNGPAPFLIQAVLTTVLSLLLPSLASANLSLLEEGIIAYNAKFHSESLSENTYRGEEGILNLGPEVAGSFGIKALMDKDYLEAKALFEEADRLFENIMELLPNKGHGRPNGNRVRKLADLAVSHNHALKSAHQQLALYRLRLDAGNDQRLDKTACTALLKRLLKEGLQARRGNLREALGYVHSRCQGVENIDHPLTTENILFVNYVFQGFVENATDKEKTAFDLDRSVRNSKAGAGAEWKRVVGSPGSRFIPMVAAMLEGHRGTGYPLDPLLFMALMMKESRFDPSAVSGVGAVGLAQLMPRTAKNLGMKNIFQPPYLDQARALTVRGRRLKDKALALIPDITDQNGLVYAERAISLMQQSLDLTREAMKLYGRYRKEVLGHRNDDRLNPRKAIECGFRYFSRMMKEQDGDMSMALSAYNAGPHRVKRFKGIPPYKETVFFRNGVLDQYREYLERLKK